MFITNKCNAGCFYCPAEQNDDDKHTTQGIEFDNPLAYAEYIKHFGFKGISFSGGEPLLFFNKTLEYLKAVRNTSGNHVYIWMYTNGVLANEENLIKLGLL